MRDEKRYVAFTIRNEYQRDDMLFLVKLTLCPLGLNYCGDEAGRSKVALEVIE